MTIEEANMGMFDYINYKMNCPDCGEEVTSFQSKDGNCLLETLEPYQVSNFYGSCKCGKWIEFTRKENPDEDISKYFNMNTKRF